MVKFSVQESRSRRIRIGARLGFFDEGLWSGALMGGHRAWQAD